MITPTWALNVQRRISERAVKMAALGDEAAERDDNEGAAAYQGVADGLEEALDIIAQELAES